MNQIIEVTEEIIFHAVYASDLNDSRFLQIIRHFPNKRPLHSKGIHLHTCTLRNYFKLSYSNEPIFHIRVYYVMLRQSGENHFRSHTVLSSRITQT